MAAPTRVREEVVAGISLPRRRYKSQTRQIRNAIQAGIELPQEVLGALADLERVEQYLSEARELTEQRREEYRNWVQAEQAQNAAKAAKTPPGEFEPVVPEYDLDRANAVLAAYEDAARAAAAKVTTALRSNAPTVFDSIEAYWKEHVAFTVRSDWKVSTMREKQAAVAEKKAAALVFHKEVMAELYGLDPDLKQQLRDADDLVDPYKLIQKRRAEVAEREKVRQKKHRPYSVGGLAGLDKKEVAAERQRVREAAKLRARQLTGVGSGRRGDDK